MSTEDSLETEFDCDYNDDPVCPYCGNTDERYGGDLPKEAYQDDGVWENQCGECEKNYRVLTSISRSYSTDKSVCLNGSPHKMTYKYKLWENLHNFRCRMCSEEQNKKLSDPPTDDEKKDYDLESYT